MTDNGGKTTIDRRRAPRRNTHRHQRTRGATTGDARFSTGSDGPRDNSTASSRAWRTAGHAPTPSPSSAPSARLLTASDSSSSPHPCANASATDPPATRSPQSTSLRSFFSRCRRQPFRTEHWPTTNHNQQPHTKGDTSCATKSPAPSAERRPGPDAACISIRSCGESRRIRGAPGMGPRQGTGRASRHPPQARDFSANCSAGDGRTQGYDFVQTTSDKGIRV